MSPLFLFKEQVFPVLRLFKAWEKRMYSILIFIHLHVFFAYKSQDRNIEPLPCWGFYPSCCQRYFKNRKNSLTHFMWGQHWCTGLDFFVNSLCWAADTAQAKQIRAWAVHAFRCLSLSSSNRSPSFLLYRYIAFSDRRFVLTTGRVSIHPVCFGPHSSISFYNRFTQS